MVQVIQQPGKFDAFADFGTVLGDVLKQQSAKKQQAQAQQEFQNILPNLDPNKPLNIQQTLQLQKLAQQAGYDPKAVMEAIKLNKPSFLQQLKDENQLRNNQPILQQVIGEEEQLTPLEKNSNILVDSKEQVQPFDYITDQQAQALLASPDPAERAFAQGLIDQRKEVKKDFREERDYNTKRTEKYTDKMENLRSVVDDKKRTIRNMKFALGSRDFGLLSQDWWAQQLGSSFVGLITPEGQIFNQGVKEFLVDSYKELPARGINMFVEKTIASAISGIGKSAIANRMGIELFDEKVALEDAEIKAYDEIAENHMKKYGYVKMGIEKEVKNKVKEFKKESANRVAYKLRSIIESEKSDDELKELAKKRVGEGTPMTARNKKIFQDVYGDKARDMAKKLGYVIYSKEELEKL
jgi:hypothetical protein